MEKNPEIIKRIIKKMGGSIENVIPERNCFYFKLKGRRILITRKFALSRSPLANSRVSKFKDLTYFLFNESCIPTPRTICLYRKTFDLQKTKKVLARLPYPVIIKDAAGSNSMGIFPNIPNPKAALNIIQKELKNYPGILVQEMVFGKEYRLLVLNNKIIGALEMIPPRIIGNGHLTVRQLIRKKQSATDKKTPFDMRLKRLLQKQGVGLESILKKGQAISIKNNSSLAEGGETKDCTNIVHRDIENICVKASKVIEKYLVGIDIICEDISKKPAKQSFSVLEINSKPDLYIHYNPTFGKTRNVVKDIVSFVIKMTKF